MAYSQEQWDKVKALFESGMTLAEISKRTGIDKATVSRKSRALGWESTGNATLIKKEVDARQTLIEVEDAKATKNATEREVINTLVSERMQHEKFFRGANLLVAKTATSKLQRDGLNATYQDVNAAANAIAKAQDGVLGKSPDTVINNTNNQQTNALVVEQSPDRVRQIRAMLDSHL